MGGELGNISLRTFKAIANSQNITEDTGFYATKSGSLSAPARVDLKKPDGTSYVIKMENNLTIADRSAHARAELLNLAHLKLSGKQGGTEKVAQLKQDLLDGKCKLEDGTEVDKINTPLTKREIRDALTLMGVKLKPAAGKREMTVAELLVLPEENKNGSDSQLIDESLIQPEENKNETASQPTDESLIPTGENKSDTQSIDESPISTEEDKTKAKGKVSSLLIGEPLIQPEENKAPEKVPGTSGHAVMSRDTIMAMEGTMTVEVKGEKITLSPKEAQEYVESLEAEVTETLKGSNKDADYAGLKERTKDVHEIMGKWLDDPKFIASGLVLAKAKGYQVRTQKDIAGSLGMQMDGNGLFMVGKPKLALFAPKIEVVKGSGQVCAEKIAAEHPEDDATISCQIFADATKIGGGTMSTSWTSQEESWWRDSCMAFFGEMLQNCTVKNDGTYVAPHINKGEDGMPIFNSAAGYTADGEMKSNGLLPLKDGKPIKMQYCFTASPARCTDGTKKSSSDVDNVATFAMVYQKLVSKHINVNEKVPENRVEGAKAIIRALTDLAANKNFAPNHKNKKKIVDNLYQKTIDLVISDGLVIDGQKVEIFKARTEDEAKEIAMKLLNAFVKGKIKDKTIKRAQEGVTQALRLADRNWVLITNAKYNIKGLGGTNAFGCTMEMVIPNQMDNWVSFSGGRALVYSDFEGEMEKMIRKNADRADREVVKILQGYGYDNDEIMEGFRVGRRTNAEIRERFRAAGVKKSVINNLIAKHPAVGYDADK